jgi:hypothetical protein
MSAGDGKRAQPPTGAGDPTLFTPALSSGRCWPLMTRFGVPGSLRAAHALLALATSSAVTL